MLSAEGNGMGKGGDLAAVFAALILTHFYSSVCRIWVRPFTAQQCKESCIPLREGVQVVAFHPFFWPDALGDYL